jgi:monoamine oxidase
MDRGAVIRPSRRSFLALAGSAVVAAGCTAAREAGTPLAGSSLPGTTVAPRPDPGARRRVVVAGAGLAGLTTALDLVDAGWDVVVLEARDRVGGRVHTLHDPFTDGLHAEAGGESIDDGHDRIQALVTRFGLSLERRPDDKLLTAAVLYDGTRSTLGEFVARREGKVGADFAAYSVALANLGEGMDPARPDQFAGAEKLDQTTLVQFIADQQLVAEADFLVRVEARAGFAADPADVSLLFAVQQAVSGVSEGESGSETMRITGGNSMLVEAMAGALGERVQLTSPVTRIDHGADGVRVFTGERFVDASRLVVAMPTPPLRNVEFRPALPTTAVAMVNNVALGPAAKVVTQYQRRFWEPLGLSGFSVTDQPYGVGWSPTDSYTSDGGLLSQFITGSVARDAARLDDAERIRQFQDQLRTVFPQGDADRTDHAATVAWTLEPFTGGGYTAYQPQQLTSYWSTLRAGIGPIRFAGEHTEAMAGFMESAVRSGHRVAADIGAPPPP